MGDTDKLTNSDAGKCECNVHYELKTGAKWCLHRYFGLQDTDKVAPANPRVNLSMIF